MLGTKLPTIKPPHDLHQVEMPHTSTLDSCAAADSITNSCKIQKSKILAEMPEPIMDVWSYGLLDFQENPKIQRCISRKTLDFGIFQEWCLLVEQCYFRKNTALFFLSKTFEEQATQEGQVNLQLGFDQPCEGQGLSLTRNVGTFGGGRICDFVNLRTCASAYLRRGISFSGLP